MRDLLVKIDTVKPRKLHKDTLTKDDAWGYWRKHSKVQFVTASLLAKPPYCVPIKDIIKMTTESALSLKKMMDKSFKDGSVPRARWVHGVMLHLSLVFHACHTMTILYTTTPEIKHTAYHGSSIHDITIPPAPLTSISFCANFCHHN